MKKTRIDDDLVTKGYLRDQFDQFRQELLEAFRGYRDEVLERMDRDAAELEQIRENQVFMQHDIQNHEQRITKLENA